MLLSLLTSLAVHAAPLKYPVAKPKLVVVVVIDQFRADYLSRFGDRFLPAQGKGGDVGGFRYLMSKGAYYPQAHYDVLQNMTCPGHATILTGSTPARTGIPLNDWYDRGRGKMRYCVADDVDGISPRQLTGSTVGDELKNAGYPGKVVALALKDRAAVLLGGHRADLAFWFDDGQWKSSSYYGADLPAWLVDLNKSVATENGKSLTWKRDAKSSGFSVEKDFSKTSTAGKFDSLEGPYGTTLTTNAAIAAMKGMKLGQSKTTDLMAISFSSHDYEGHKVGPNAPEMEDLTVNEDAALATLLNAARKAVPGGLKNVVVALTADHGMAPAIDYLKTTKTETGAIDAAAAAQAIEDDLSKAFGKRKYIAAVESFNFYFTPDALDHVKRSDLENHAKTVIAQITGVAHVFSLSDYLNGNLPVGDDERQIKKQFVPGKSGDVVLIPKPFYYEAGPFATHMTGYSYDRTVPLVIAGPHLRAGVYGEDANAVDLAPTLSFLLGVLPPAQSQGRVLSEAIGD